MPNPNKYQGQSEFEVGGEKYLLEYNGRSLIELERRTGKGIIAITKAFGDEEKFTLELLTHVLHAGLLTHHEDVTFDRAADMVVEMGGMIKAANIVNAAMAVSLNKDAAGPPQNGVGTGTKPLSRTSKQDSTRANSGA